MPLFLLRVQIPHHQNTTDYDAKINGYRQFWVAYSQNATYPGNSTAEFRNLLLQLKKQTNVVVVNMYIPSWQHTPKGTGV